MKYSVHHMHICELWRYYLNYRAIVDFGISDTASPAFNRSNSDLCVQQKCSGSVGTASIRQSRGCILQVISFFLRISLEDTTTLKLCGNNRRTRVMMRHHLTVEMATEFLNAVRVRPCFFLYRWVRPSVSVFFFGWRVRMSVIQTAKIPKIGKIGAKIRASVC